MDNVDPSGPSAEFVNVHRRRLITKILKAIRRDEESEGHGRGKYKFPSATWFSLWLSDMDRLEEIATAFDQNPERASGLYTMTESFRLVTLWVPHSGITPKLPTIRPPSRPTSAVATPTTPSTPTINRATQLTLRTVGTPVESSPAKLSSLNQPSPTDPSPTAVQPSRKRQRIDSPANSNTASDRDRDPIFTRNCLDRDWVCGITKSTDPLQAAHICAVSLNKHKRDYTQKYIHFKSSLAVFWSDAQVRKWSDRMKTLAKSTANALALQSSAHDYWDRALFALQPISVNDQKTEMKLRFYWLKPGSLLPQGSTLLLPEDVTPNFLVDPPILADNRETGGRDHHENVSEALLALFNCQTQQIIRSGDDIIITTPDPIRFPLPDEELLRLQWILHRLAALCAAAGFHADSFFEDDDSFAGAACMVTPPGVYESVDEQDCLSKRLWEAFLCKPPQVDQSRV